MNINRTASSRSIAATLGKKTRALFLGVCALGMAVAANAHGPRFITFDAPGAGTGPYQGTGCSVSDCSALINYEGAITGYYLDASNVYHGFLRSPEGKFTTFDAPGADLTPGDTNGTFPSAINDAGAITGFYVDTNGGAHGFLRSPEGAFTTFDVPGSIVGGTIPIALNLEGRIVGFYVAQADGTFQAFLRRPNGTYATWSDPDACVASGTAFCGGTAAFSINIFGTIAGGYEDNSGNFVGHGLVRTADGRFITYKVPGAGTGSYQGTGCPGCSMPVNLFGAIAGFYIDAANVVHGFLRSPNGRFTKFNAPSDAGSQGFGCFADCPLGLNDFGATTGYYLDSNNVYRGFLRSPDGRISSFDAPGADATPGSYNGTYPNSINDQGMITGSYQDSNNTFHGFLVLP